jgi:hypothetical protein
VEYALDVKDFQIVHLPGWCDSERWDIEAKTRALDAIDPEGLRLLIRTSLETRFQFAAGGGQCRGPFWNALRRTEPQSVFRPPMASGWVRSSNCGRI